MCTKLKTQGLEPVIFIRDINPLVCSVLYVGRLVKIYILEWILKKSPMSVVTMSW